MCYCFFFIVICVCEFVLKNLFGFNLCEICYVCSVFVVFWSYTSCARFAFRSSNCCVSDMFVFEFFILNFCVSCVFIGVV